MSGSMALRPTNGPTSIFWESTEVNGGVSRSVDTKRLQNINWKANSKKASRFEWNLKRRRNPGFYLEASSQSWFYSRRCRKVRNLRDTNLGDT